jgi:DNA polymerase-3 subunit delta'
MVEIAQADIGAVVGHRAAKAEWLAAEASGKLHHGWLLRGPRGIGKARLALQFALKLLGAKPERVLEADVDDHIGRLVAAGSHPDLRIIKRPVDDKGKEKTDIPVDLVRELADFFSLRPAMGGYRVAIIDAVDELNRFGSNAILKTLEEPPARAVLFLISHGEEALLPTIRSRCRTLQLAPLSAEETSEVLIRGGMPAARAEDVAKRAPGRPGRALALQGPDADAAVEAVREALKSLNHLTPRALQAVLQSAGKSEAAMSAAMDALRGTLHRRASGEHDPVLAGDWASTWLDVQRLDAEAKALNQDRAQTLAAALDRVSAMAGSKV